MEAIESMPYSQAIDEFRKDLGVTKQAVANRLGITWNAVDAKLTGRTEFNISEVSSLADWWGVSIDRLIGRPFSEQTRPE